MRVLTDDERETAARLFPEALRLCSRFASIFRLDHFDIRSAASLAAMDAVASGRTIESRAFYRAKAEKRAMRPRSARGRPDFAGLLADEAETIAGESPESDPPEDLLLAIRSLSPRQWDAVYLTVLCGLGCAEAGRVLGIVKQAVQRHRAIAFERLRARLGQPAVG